MSKLVEELNASADVRTAEVVKEIEEIFNASEKILKEIGERENV